MGHRQAVPQTFLIPSSTPPQITWSHLCGREEFEAPPRGAQGHSIITPPITFELYTRLSNRVKRIRLNSEGGFRIDYQEAEGDADDDGGDDGDGGEVEVAEVAGKGLGDDGEGEQGDSSEDGGARDVPCLLRL